MPIAWIDSPDQQHPTPGALALNATNLNKLAVIADIPTAGTPTGDAIAAAITQQAAGIAAGLAIVFGA